MKKVSQFIGGLVATILFGGAAAAQTQQSPPPKGLHVFYTAHSLLWYVPEPLGEMARAAGIEGHELVGLTKIGGARMIFQWNHQRGKNAARKALEEGALDVLVLSPIPFPDEGLENFVKLGMEHNPQMRFLVQISWGGGDIDNQDFPVGINASGNKEKPAEQIAQLFARNIVAAEAQADDLNAKYGNGRKIIALVPSAQAMVALRLKIANGQWPGLTKQQELFVDAGHPSAPMSALNTYVHFAVLYGRSPVGLPMYPGLKKANRPAWDEDFNRRLQELAWETVTKYPPSLVTPTKP